LIPFPELFVRRRKMITKKELVFDIIFVGALALCLAIVLVCYSAEASHDVTTAPTKETTVVPKAEPSEVELPDIEETMTLYDVPLDADLQLHIIETAEANGIDPSIVLAMAFHESTYRTDAVGDNGNSYGLLQVQPRWHYARMERLGCTDLLDPYQNVVVGIDFLCEMLSKYDGDMAKALTAYNKGHYAGTVTSYAQTVLAKSTEIAHSQYEVAV
jgi:hypothetical protein